MERLKKKKNSFCFVNDIRVSLAWKVFPTASNAPLLLCPLHPPLLAFLDHEN
jgi:hypothetical protein